MPTNTVLNLPSIGLRVSGLYRRTSSGGVTPASNAQEPIDIFWDNQFVHGNVLPNQCNMWATVPYRLAAGGGDTWDLANASNTWIDLAGNPVNMTKVVAIMIRNFSVVTAKNLAIAGNWVTTHLIAGTTPSLTIRPNSPYLQTNPIDGWTVTGGTADIITVTPAGGATDIPYEMAIAGIQ